MKKIVCITLFVLFSFSLFNIIGGQRELIEKRKTELYNLSQEILKKIKNVDKYNNKKIYVKAQVLQKDNNTYELKIKKVSLNEFSSEEKAVDSNDVSSDKFIYVEGEVHSSPDKSFSLDLEHVLPPEK